MRPWEDRSEVRPGATRPCSSGRNWWSSTELCPQSVSNQNPRHSRATQCSSEGTLVAMLPRNHAATPQVLDPRVKKRQTIKSALYQQKEFLTVPLGASQTAPSVAKTVAHNTPGCCRNNFCSSQIVEISTLNAMIQKCWNWPFPESLGASCATAGRAIAQLPPGQRNLDRKSNVIWSWLCYPKPSCATAGRAIAQLASSGLQKPPEISVSEVGKIGKLKATEEASSAKPRGTVSNCLGYRGCCFRSTQEYCEQLTVLATGESASFPNYFTSCDPHHDIYPFCYWQIFWQSIWHIFWHSIWHIFWHSTWHIFWHIFWHSIWHSTDILSGILSGIPSGILSGKHSGTLSGISAGILADILPGILSGIPSGILSGILSGKSSGILSGKHSGTLSGISHGILSGISSGIRFDILSGISSGILSGRGQVPGWGPAVHTQLGRFQVEVQRCTLSWEGSRLRSSGAHSAGQVPGSGPAVLTKLGRSQVKVQRCSLSSEGPRLRSSGAHWAGQVSSDVGEELDKAEEEGRRRRRRFSREQLW